MKNITTISFLIILFLAACRDEIAFNDDQIASKMVVNSFIEPDSIIKVTVAGSKPIPGLKSNFNWIDNATIKLFVDGKEHETLKAHKIETNNYKNNNYYSKNNSPNTVYCSEITAEKGKNYKLEIQHPTYGTAKCQTTVPEPVQIISVDTIFAGIPQYNNEYNIYNVKIKFKDPENQTNYYRLIAQINQGAFRKKMIDGIAIDSAVVVQENYLQIHDPVINPEQEDANDFLFGSPINPFNIFTDELINGREYVVNFNIHLYNHKRTEGVDLLSKGEFNHVKFILQSITHDTYLFLKSKYLHHYYDGDLFAEPVQVYSNVENGLGILGGQSSSVVTFEHGNYPVDSVKYSYDQFYHYETYSY